MWSSQFVMLHKVRMLYFCFYKALDCTVSSWLVCSITWPVKLGVCLQVHHTSLRWRRSLNPVQDWFLLLCEEEEHKLSNMTSYRPLMWPIQSEIDSMRFRWPDIPQWGLFSGIGLTTRIDKCTLYSSLLGAGSVKGHISHHDWACGGRRVQWWILKTVSHLKGFFSSEKGL